MGCISFVCRADLLPLTPHVQTEGVLTCMEQKGECRVETCQPGEKKVVFERRCDSGCGYWRGRCGQVCCVYDLKAEKALEASIPHAEVNLITETNQQHTQTTEGSQASSTSYLFDMLVLVGVASLVFVVFRHASNTSPSSSNVRDGANFIRVTDFAQCPS